MGLMHVVATDIDTGDTRTWTLEEGQFVVVGNDPCRLDLDRCRVDGSTHTLTVTDVSPHQKPVVIERIG